MVKIAGHWLSSGEWRKVSVFEGCCDCGLVHRVEYKVVRGVIWRRVFRAVKVTAESRRRFKFPFSKKES